MVLKITVLLCATILIVKAQVLHPGVGSPSRFDFYGENGTPFIVKDETWYQEEAVLKVIDGTFIVELLHINSTPRSLIAEGKRIVELNRGFARISSLEQLSLEDNLIERIDGFVFEGLPKLITLNLARNRIKYLEQDSFRGLSKLKILNLDHNSLKNSMITSINHNTLPELQQLYLQHNQLIEKELGPSGSYQYPYLQLCHSNLRYLYLSNNSIHSFFDSPVCHNKLTHLFLQDNKISSGFIIDNISLEVLSLDGNEFIGIPEISSRLKFLSLARNRIGNINDFPNCQNLVGLILSYNEITSYEGGRTFDNLPNLEHLALDYNLLTETMPHNFFHKLTSLRSLDLTGNEIGAQIHSDQFAHLPNLEKLYLGSNRLVSFPGNESGGGSKLSYLDLSNNTIENISDLELNMIPTLKVLKVTGNPLGNINSNSVPRSNLTILL